MLKIQKKASSKGEEFDMHINSMFGVGEEEEKSKLEMFCRYFKLPVKFFVRLRVLNNYIVSF